MANKTLPHEHRMNRSNINHLRFCDMSSSSSSSLPPHNKIIRLNHPTQLQRTVCCGSSKGWLIMVDLISRSQPMPYEYNDESDIFLFNPISGDVHQLPSLHTIVLYYKHFVMQSDNRKKRSLNLSFVRRIELSSPNVNSEECIVAAAFESSLTSTMVAICKPIRNKQHWNIINIDGTNFRFIDFLFNTINSSTTLQVMGKARQLEDYNNLECDEVKLKIISCSGWYRPWFDSKSYLVESLISDEIFLIRRIYRVHETKGFHVLKMDCNTDKWSKVRNIGDQLIFISTRGSVTISAKEFARDDVVQGNCIYFAEDDEYCTGKPLRINSINSGVYYLEGGRIEKLIPSVNLPLLSCVRWFTPIL